MRGIILRKRGLSEIWVEAGAEYRGLVHHRKFGYKHIYYLEYTSL